MNIFNSIFAYLQETFTERLPYFPTNIRSSLFIILFCLVALAELYVYIILRRVDRHGKQKQLKKWAESVQTMLANIVIYDDSDNADEIATHFYPRLKKLSGQNKEINKMLVTEIMIYHKNFTGKTAEVLGILYTKLGLDQKTKRKINNRNWEIKIEGIREASQMSIISLADTILAYTDDENALLRMEAQAAFIRLAPSNPFRFLARAQERILDWHQLVLFEVITKNKRGEIPSFAQWLRSPNDTVVTLCLKLVDFYMQFDAADELIRLLQHPNPRVRKSCVQILGKLEIDSAENKMFELYFEQTEPIKIEILAAFGRISSGRYIDFLTSRIFANNYNIRIAALRALKNFPEKGNGILQNILLKASPENRGVISHVLDERIKA